MIRICLVTLLCLLATRGLPDETTAKRILDETGIIGGLIVHLGCGNGKLTAALYQYASQGGRYRHAPLVQGLETDPEKVKAARRYIQSLNIYGPVSIELWDGGRLPYAEDLVNLLLVTGEPHPSVEEILRVLVPGGIALIPARGNARAVEIGGRRWLKILKPRPEGIDEWTHYLHDATGNAVARDLKVGPPRRVKWISNPPHTRSHEHLPSIMALVSSKGRIFYLADRGPISSIRRPAQWYLVARDAFNGVLLWERPIKMWFPHIWNWGATPLQLQRRLVAIGDRVYVTLGLFAPLSLLDGATGKTIKVYGQTKGTDEIVYHKGILLLVIRQVTKEREEELVKWMRLQQVENSPLYARETAQPLLKQFRSIESKAPKSIVAVEAESGRLLWRKGGREVARLKPVSLCAEGDLVFYQNGGEVVCLDLRTGRKVWSKRSPTLRLVSNGHVICADGREIMALSAKTGDLLWRQTPLLYQIRDAFVIGDSLWLGGFKQMKKKRSPAWGPYCVTRRDLNTGEVLRYIEPENPGHHHRCWRNKATVRYILSGRRGVEFVDLNTGDVLWHNWVRGVCRYGIMPCNGLLYAPPHACGCYITAKLDGFYALAPANGRSLSEMEPKLERGPAYDAITKPKGGKTAEWPTYRHDPMRSGYTPSQVPVQLRRRWMTVIGGKLSSITIAEGKVFVASVDRHTVYALDADTGGRVWSFTAGARVDSPPTIYKGRAIFGCHDGYLYCLRASDGELAWRLRVARGKERIVAYGQLESPWPLHGSVLVEDGSIYLAVGRSSYLDGGIDLYRIRPETGEVLSKRRIYSPDPRTGRQPKQYSPSAMPGALTDILTADERYIYLRDTVLDKLSLRERPRGEPHLLTLTGFLDKSWPHRSYWIFGTHPSLATGCSGRERNLIYGRLLLFDGSSVYGYGRASVHWSNQLQDKPYRLFALSLADRKMRWTKRLPVQVRAMVLSEKVLFAAGASALLIAISSSDGTELARYRLDSSPVFDGMGAAYGRIYLACEDGQIICMGE